MPEIHEIEKTFKSTRMNIERRKIVIVSLCETPEAYWPLQRERCPSERAFRFSQTKIIPKLAAQTVDREAHRGSGSFLGFGRIFPRPFQSNSSHNFGRFCSGSHAERCTLSTIYTGQTNTAIGITTRNHPCR